MSSYDNIQYYQIGDETIDNQHQGLLEALGRYIEKIRKRVKTSELLTFTDFLKQYALDHFTDEEMLMAKLNCQVKEQNEKEHNQFIERLCEARNTLQVRGATPQLAKQLHSDLRLWFIGHIGRIDKEMSTALGSQPKLVKQNR